MRLDSKAKLVLVICCLLSVSGYFLLIKDKKEERKDFNIGVLKARINQELKNGDPFTQTIDIEKDHYVIDYTLEKDLQKFIKKRLAYYRPNKAAIVVLKNSNGSILSAIGYDRKLRKYDKFLPFTGTHPSASLFKIITAAELLEDNEIHTDDKVKYRGRGTTLYKYQLKDKPSRWNRSISFEKAFAYSNNVVFGKVAIENTTPFEIREMAEKMGFNKSLMKEVDLSKSIFQTPKEGYNLAEIASGFNKKTLMSPVHCALLSSVIANEGKLIKPRLVEKVVDGKNTVVWDNQVKEEMVMPKEAAGEVESLMMATINKGTGRRIARRLKRKVKNHIVMGGKSGSITGGFPHGKRDWFTSFAYPKEKREDGISVCVMNINFDKWYVKSTKLTKEIIEYYYSKIDRVY